jgi:hypothetical protein
MAVLNACTQQGAKNSLFLARSTWNEQRELLLQVHDPEIADTALQEILGSKQWQRSWEYRMQDEPQWKEAAYVFALFPMADGNDAWPDPALAACLASFKPNQVEPLFSHPNHSSLSPIAWKLDNPRCLRRRTHLSTTSRTE